MGGQLSINARDDRGAYTHALHRSFFPLGPFRHSGLWVALQLAQLTMPTGGLPGVRLLLPLPYWSLLLFLRPDLGGGTASLVGDGGCCSSGSEGPEAGYCMALGLGMEGPTGETGEPVSKYDECHWWWDGWGGAEAENDEERMLLTGVPFGRELGAHCAYWLELDSMLTHALGG